ncbi:MAG: tetratricopeptide repeat protein [Myxococcota bacterium]
MPPPRGRRPVEPGQPAPPGRPHGRGRALYRRAREASAAHGQVRAEASALHNLAGLLAERGDLEGAVHTARQALQAARAAGEGLLVAHALHTLGYLLHRLDRLDEAEPAYVEAVGLLRRLDPALAASALGDLEALLADLDLVDAAEQTLAEAEAGVQPDERPALAAHRAHLDLALAQRARGRDRARLLARAAARIEEAAAGDQATMAVQLARRRLHQLGAEPADPR